MGLSDDIENLEVVQGTKRRQAEAQRVERTHPKGWESGVEFTGQTGVLSTGPRTVPGAPSNAEWTDLLNVWDLDPEVYEIDPNYNPEFRAWDANMGAGSIERFYYYKARIRLRAAYYGLDIKELLVGIGRHKKPKRSLLIPDEPVDLLMCLSDWQIGKALSDDTPVLTPGGWVLHGHLRAGDSVYGVNGNPVRVLSVTGSAEQPCSRIGFDNGVSLVASGQHGWLGWDSRKASDGQPPQQQLVYTTQEIIQRRFIDQDAPDQAGEGFRIGLPQPVLLDSVQMGVDPYLWGAWISGGDADTGKIVVPLGDAAHWANLFETQATFHAVPQIGYVGIAIEGLLDDLYIAGLLSPGQIPPNLLLGSVSQRLRLLQGLLDVGASVTSSGIVKVTADIQIVDAVDWLVASLGMKTLRSQVQGLLPNTSGKPIYSVEFMPDGDREDHQVFRMKPKLAQLTTSDSGQSRSLLVRSVEPAGMVSAQCITVEGGLYLAGHDLVVTHNSDGDGVKGTIDRVMTSFDRVADYVADLRRINIDIGCLYLIGMGDLVEQCVAPETQVVTNSGTQRIDKLAIEGHAVLQTTRGEWVNADVKSFGKQRLLKITMSRMGVERTEWATPGHRWFRLDSSLDATDGEEVVTAELGQGDFLASTFADNPYQIDALGVQHGYGCPDGHSSSLNSPIPTSPDVRPFPRGDETPEYLMGWAAGYFATAGDVDETVHVSSTDVSALERYAWVCSHVGIGTQPITCKRYTTADGGFASSYRLALIESTIPEWFFVEEPHRLAFKQMVGALSNYLSCCDRDRYWCIESVEDVGREDEVYCAVVSETHAFALVNDLLTGNCWGNYPSQPFTVELNRREQLRLTRRCLRDGTIGLSKIVPRLILGGVGGNHGENRGGSSSSGGKAKAFTTPGDNDDVAIFEMVAEILSMNDDAFGHVKYVIPDEELAIVLDIGGVVVGFTHGHLCTKGGAVEQKVYNWWTGQMAGERPVGDARLLFTGHYHHLCVKNFGPRTWIQCPAQDGGSIWWQNATGSQSSPGALVCTVGANQGNELGYDFLRIL